MNQSYDGFSQVAVSVADGVALVVLDNPPVNAVGRTLQDEMIAALDRLSVDDAVRAIVLTGKGKVFCAGADIRVRRDIATDAAKQRDHLRSARESYNALVECPKPIVAAINGAALGAGLAIVASCDILLASETAVLGMPEVDVGLMGGARHAMRLFSHSRLRRMAFSGYRVPAAELYRLGIVEACLPPGELLPAAMAIAAEIASKAPLSVQAFKQSLNAIAGMSLRDGYRYEQDMTIAITKTEDSKEAMQAFMEKRAPVFRGR